MLLSQNIDRKGAHLQRPFSFYALAGIVLLAGALRIVNLNDSLWFDELWSTRVHLGDPALLLKSILRTTHPPFHYLLMYPWIHLFGDSEISIRLPFLLFGIGSIVLTYCLGKSLGNEKAGLLAALSLAIAPAHIWYSQESRPYTALSFFLLLAVLAFLRLRERPESIAWRRAYLLALLGLVLGHYFSVLFLPLFVLLAKRQPKPHRFLLLAPIIAAAALAVAVGSQILFASFFTSNDYLRLFTLFEWWQLFFQWFALGNSLYSLNPYSAAQSGFASAVSPPGKLVLQLLFVLPFLLSLFSLRDSSQRRTIGLLLCFLLIVPASLLALSQIGFSNIFIERSLFSVLPFFFLVIWFGVFQVRTRRGQIVLGLAILSIQGAANLGFHFNRDQWTVYKPKPDWRAAAQFLVEENGGAANVWVFTASPAHVLRYYQHQIKPRLLNSNPPTANAQFQKHPPHTFFVIKNRHWQNNYDRTMEAVFTTPHYYLSHSLQLRSLEIHSFTRSTLE